MGSKSVLEERAKLKLLHGPTHPSYGERHIKSSSAAQQGAICNEKWVEYCCSCCMFSLCCPLALAWCCIKVPCKVCQRGMQRAGHWFCCGRMRRASKNGYSSFSDIELEESSSSKNQTLVPTKFIVPIN